MERRSILAARHTTSEGDSTVKPTTHIRDGNKVMRLSDGDVEVFKSIALAKKRSAELQRGGAVLRRGDLAAEQEKRLLRPQAA
jgi:hypothetical protein